MVRVSSRAWREDQGCRLRFGVSSICEWLEGFVADLKVREVKGEGICMEKTDD